MSSPNVPLRTVLRITETSVLLVPADGATVDFRTVSSVPPLHRSVLQRNGFVAKLYISVPSGAPVERAARRRLWLRALKTARLIDREAQALAVPADFAPDAWPLLPKSEFDRRMAYAFARQTDPVASSAANCVPVVAAQQWIHQEPDGARAHIGVVWMPRYDASLTDWAERRGADSPAKPVPERMILTMIQHAASGLSSLSAIDAVAAGATRRCLESEHILVNEVNGLVSFALVVSPMTQSPRQHSLLKNLPSSRHRQLNLLPYMSPEQIDGSGAGPSYAVWALGAIALVIAAGTPSVAGQIDAQNARKAELPLNHPRINPDALVARVHRDLVPRGYTASLRSFIALALGQDLLTRPALRSLASSLHELNRAIPIHRFPFVLGDLSLLPVPGPGSIQMNPSARKYVTTDECCHCKQERAQSQCKGGDHVPAVTSPPWGTSGSDEQQQPLPGLSTPPGTSTAFLYPLLPEALDDRERRRLLAHAVQGARGRLNITTSWVRSGAAPARVSGRSPFSAALLSSVAAADTPTINRASLFQIFGGFAVLEPHPAPAAADDDGPLKDRALVTELFVPFPTKALRPSEASWAVTELGFTAALPWPSFCTQSLRKKGRICAGVPAFLGGATGCRSPLHDQTPKHFAWLVPGEKLPLANGQHWRPAPAGGFVVWFGEGLEPTDADRYFAIVSGGAASRAALCVSETVLPDPVLRQHIGDEAYRAAAALPQSISYHSLSARHRTPSRLGRGGSAATSAAALGRRSSCRFSLVDVPCGTDIYESDADTAVSAHASLNVSTASNGGHRPRSPTAVSWKAARQAKVAQVGPSGSDEPAAARTHSTRRHLSPLDRRGRRSSNFNPTVVEPPVPGAARPRRVESPQSQLMPEFIHADPPRPGAATASAPPSLAVCPPVRAPLMSVEPPTTRGAVPPLCPRNANTVAVDVTPMAGKLTPSKVAGRSHSTAALVNRPPRAQLSPLVTPRVSRLGAIAGLDENGDVPRIALAQFMNVALSGGGGGAAAAPCTLEISNGSYPPVSIFARWVAADALDAPFDSLTFVVPSTAEYGSLQRPVHLTATARAVLRCPAEAAFMAFLSSTRPLLARNHSALARDEGPAPHFPHHGFVIYGEDAAVLGAVALRCGPAGSFSADLDKEFPIIARLACRRRGSATSTRDYYASYFTFADLRLERMTAPTPLASLGSSDRNNSHSNMRHTPEASGPHPNPHMLTFTSAQHLIGDFSVKGDAAAAVRPGDFSSVFGTPGRGGNETPGSSADLNPDTMLPVCWMGFDAEGGALVMCGVDQAVWHHLLIA